jgi:hypothetical protein
MRRLGSIGLPERAAQITASLVDPARRLAAQASLALRAGRASEAARLASEASAADATRLDAREIALAAGVPDAERSAEAGTYGPRAKALLQARRAAALAEPDWALVRSLDAPLAAIDPRSALATEAVKLRAGSRLASGDPAQAREGMQILDALLPRFRTRADLRLRAQLAEAAGATSGALWTWMELATAGEVEGRAAAAARGSALARSAKAASLSQQERDAWLRDFAAVKPSVGGERGAK